MKQDLIEVNNKFYQKCDCILLPTEKATWPNCIWLGRTSGRLRLDKSYNDKPKSIPPIDNSMLPQHLYFFSDEEIKEGDYHYNSDNNTIAQAKISLGIKAPKVIATTDSELWTKTPIDGAEGHFLNKPLPRPSNSFIDKFLSEYNAGRKIEKVLVEMNREFEYEASAGKSYSFSVKVAPDNTITIKPLVMSKLEQLALLLEKAGVRKYLNINSFGYSQIERDIVQLFE